MKKAIFLVEDFDEKEGNRPVPFLEKLYQKMYHKTLEEKEINRTPYLAFITEVPKMLYASGDDYIEFIKVSDFITSVNLTSFPKDVDVFYFISVWQQLSFFHFTYFMCMDPDVIDFLVKHKVPIIFEASMDIDRDYVCSMHDIVRRREFNVSGHPWNTFFREIHTLDYYVVGCVDYSPRDYTSRPYEHTSSENFWENYKELENIFYGVFPGTFFHSHKHSKNSIRRLENRQEQLIETIKNRKLTEDKMVWQALAASARGSRFLFQMYVEYEKLTNFGRYSRLDNFGPNSVVMEQFANDILEDKDFQRMPYFDSDFSKLDELKIIDTPKFVDSCNINFGAFDDFEFMVWVVLETSNFMNKSQFVNTSSFLTEKTMQPIVSGHPFIPVGGQKNGKILKDYGFKEYPLLEFPTQPHFLDELDYVIEKLKFICNMTFSKKIDLYESWKDACIYNYNNYVSSNMSKLYISNIHRMKKETLERINGY